jgi:hypothetical protein
MGGGSARDYMDRPFLARTPAEFWRRYNRNVQQFFLHDVFNPDFPLGRRMSASGFSRQFCANFEGNSGAIDAKIGTKMTENQPRSTVQEQSAA